MLLVVRNGVSALVLGVLGKAVQNLTLSSYYKVKNLLGIAWTVPRLCISIVIEFWTLFPQHTVATAVAGRPQSLAAGALQLLIKDQLPGMFLEHLSKENYWIYWKLFWCKVGPTKEVSFDTCQLDVNSDVTLQHLECKATCAWLYESTFVRQSKVVAAATVKSNLSRLANISNSIENCLYSVCHTLIDNLKVDSNQRTWKYHINHRKQI